MVMCPTKKSSGKKVCLFVSEKVLIQLFSPEIALQVSVGIGLWVGVTSLHRPEMF